MARESTDDWLIRHATAALHALHCSLEDGPPPPTTSENVETIVENKNRYILFITECKTNDP
jgi:hypothetical protein